MRVTAHYNADYYRGFAGLDIGRTYQAHYFRPYCAAHLTVLDFGCADGLMLRSLPARRRIGVEVNPAARAQCTGLDELYASLAMTPARYVDLAISNHALEHCENPLRELRGLRLALKPGGTLAVVVPFERERRAWTPGNADHHLFTWTPQTFGNLVSEAGFAVRSCDSRSGAWHPKMFWTRHLGLFPATAWTLGVLLGRQEIFCVATAPLG